MIFVFRVFTKENLNEWEISHHNQNSRKFFGLQLISNEEMFLKIQSVMNYYEHLKISSNRQNQRPAPLLQVFPFKHYLEFDS